MIKTFEKTLPEGYEEALVVDATNKKVGLIMNAIALGVMTIIIVGGWFILRPPLSATSPLHFLLLAGMMLVYLVLHELVHGVAYKLLTKEKLTFGMTWSAAFCGVPQIYVYRTAALVALLAPFVTFTLLFGGLAIFLSGVTYQFLFLIMLGIHVGGCSGDLYGTVLYLFKFKASDVLMQDTGPKQTFYVKKA